MIADTLGREKVKNRGEMFAENANTCGKDTQHDLRVHFDSTNNLPENHLTLHLNVLFIVQQVCYYIFILRKSLSEVFEYEILVGFV